MQPKLPADENRKSLNLCQLPRQTVIKYALDDAAFNKLA